MTPDDLDLRHHLADDAERIDATGDFARVAIARGRRQSRNRVVAGGVAAAAAVAIAVPLVWSSTRPTALPAPAPSTSTGQVTSAPPSSVPTSDTPTSPAPTSPTTGVTSTSASTVPAAPPPTANSNGKPGASVEVAIGPVVGPPTVAYAADGVFHDGDLTVPLPFREGLQLVARLQGGGVLAAYDANGSRTLHFLDARGTLVKKVTSAQDIVVNTSGTRVAANDINGTLRFYDASGAELANLPTGDPGASPRAIWGDRLLYSVSSPEGLASARVWDTGGTTTRKLFDGNVGAVHEGRSLALMWPNQDYDPEHTCYGIYDLAAGAMDHYGCGEFAPTHFSTDGSMIVGPNVADGPGSSGWKVVGTDSGQVLLAVSAGTEMAPSWTGTARGIALTLADTSGSRARQTIVSCEVTGDACTTAVVPVSLSGIDLDVLNWPIMLSAN